MLTEVCLRELVKESSQATSRGAVQGRRVQRLLFYSTQRNPGATISP